MADTIACSEKLPRGRRQAFRLLALMLGIALVFLLEGALRLTSFGRLEDIGDPFVGFSRTVPLFVLDDKGERYVIPKSRQVFFQPDSFAAQKSPSEFRIFCLGGSTVQGRPYSIETSFSTWLELSLEAASPSIDWQVVNCGGVSYASYRLIPIMQEVLQYEPDMFIVCTGHNEFLEERTYANIKHRPRWLVNLHERMSGSRIYGVGQQLFGSASSTPDPVNLPAEVDALLDYQGGLAKYHRDDAWRDGVVLHYRHNLRRMIHIASAAGVPLVCVNPVSNIRDTPPFKVEWSDHLSESQRVVAERLWQLAKDAPWDDLPNKLGRVQDVLTLDERHAEARFLLAKIYEAMGEFEKAKQEYLLAKDEDVCPLRMLESMHETLKEVAERTDTTLVDARRHFEALAQHGMVGDEQLIDHIHPRIEGHQQVARLLFEQMVQDKIVTPQAGWQEAQQRLYDANYRSLPDNYFPESIERLRGLQKWTQGRVTRLKLSGASE